MADHFKKLMPAKAAVDSSAPKSLHTSLKSQPILSAKLLLLYQTFRGCTYETTFCSLFSAAVENRELWRHDSEMPLSPGLQLEEVEEEYLCFLQDLTNDILIRSCYQNEAFEDVFQMHIKSKRHNLDEVKMRRIVQSLRKELNITNHADPSIS